MGRHAEREGPDDDVRLGWREHLALAVAVLGTTCLGIIWAGGGWRLGLVIGASAAVVVVGALALGGTMPKRPEPPEHDAK
ncbi:MAG: hypothetical protein GX593_08520 [Actinomycetales bacterium]|nr:hypothetical protein [Actinomycetales bacterium]